MIRTTRDVPVLFNDTSLLSKREWRNRAIPVVDGFMFEAAETPEDKLFNLQLGHSTGKVIWTYVGSHTEYNREHMKNDRVRGWFSYPVESQEAADRWRNGHRGRRGNGVLGVESRSSTCREGPLAYESGRYVQGDFRYLPGRSMTRCWRRRAGSAGRRAMLVGDQTIDWYRRQALRIEGDTRTMYHGAWQVLKDQRIRSRAFPRLPDDARATREIQDGVCTERAVPERCAVRHAGADYVERRKAR